MDDVMVPSAASVNAQSRYGWPINAGALTVKMTCLLQFAARPAPDGECYPVYYSGTNYRIFTAKITTSCDNATIEANLPDISCTLTAVITCLPQSVSGPSPVLSPIMQPSPAPTPVPDTAPAQTGIAGFISSFRAIVFGTFAIGEISGAVILLAIGKIPRFKWPDWKFAYLSFPSYR